MKLSKLATIGFASALLLGSVVEATISSKASNASPSNASTSIVAQNTLRSGSFLTTEKDHPTKGTARIVNENGQRYLEFDRAFETGKGPDVQVILHRNDVVPVNVREQNYITLAPLKSFNGVQRYAIPANVDLDDFQSVAIWCRKFNITFGYAAL